MEQVEAQRPLLTPRKSFQVHQAVQPPSSTVILKKAKACQSIYHQASNAQKEFRTEALPSPVEISSSSPGYLQIWSSFSFCPSLRALKEIDITIFASR